MEQQIIVYSVNQAEISKMSNIYMKLTIENLDDQEGFDSVHTARMVMVKHRTSVDKLCKSANENAQKFIKNNNANAAKLTDLMAPIETHLKTEEDKVTKEKERIKAEEERLEKEKIQKRVDALFAVNMIMPFFDVAMMDDVEYNLILDANTKKYESEQLRIAEEKKRLETERLELERLRKKEEADRKAESERLEMLAKGQAIEADRLAKIQADIDAKEKALKDEQDKLESDKKAEQARKDLEILKAKLAEEAKAKAEKEAGIKAERELREQQEQEAAEVAKKAWQETLRPDKDKIIKYAETIASIVTPEVKDETAYKIVEETEYELAEIAQSLIKRAKEL